MKREPHKRRLERCLPWMRWHGHPWAPWTSFGPYRIQVRSSAHPSLSWLPRRDREPTRSIVLLLIAGRNTQYRVVDHDDSVPHAVNEAVKDLRMDVIIIARMLRMDTSSLKVNPDPR